MSEIIKNPEERIGLDIVSICANFRAECITNGTKYKKEEFLIGILLGMKVYVTIEYKEGQELEAIGFDTSS